MTRLVQVAVELQSFLDSKSWPNCVIGGLVVMKAVAGREQDWLDIKGVLVPHGKRLDWHTLIRELRPLCELKEAPELLEQLQGLRAQTAPR